MLATHPAHLDSPLFQIPQADLLSPLTDSAARKHLKQVSSLLGLHRSLTFHDFRGGGGTWAFQHGVPIQDIQAQGTWPSSCVWRYLTLPAAQSRVQLHSDHICTPSLFSLPLLGVWGPSLHYHITFLS